MVLAARLKKYFNRRPYLAYLLLALVAGSLFAYLAATPTFADPDSFYHAKLSLLLAQRGAFTEFPWLSATGLKDSFVDHHFLYHLLLLPFVLLLPPLIGLKAATVIFATLFILVFYWFLRQFQIKGAIYYALFLLTVNPFVFRLNLAKTSALALILVFVAAYLIFKRYYLALVLWSYVYVWTYGGWPAMLLLVGAYIGVCTLWSLQQRGSAAVHLSRVKIFKQNFYLLVSAVIGLVAGLIFSPYFPANLNFYWQQIIQIAVVNYQYVIGVGGEWYPYALPQLLGAALPFFILTWAAVLAFIFAYRRQPIQSWFFFLIAFVFFGLTLKSRRYVEYFVPLGVAFAAISLNAYWREYREKILAFAPGWLLAAALITLVIATGPVFYHDISGIRPSYLAGFGLEKFAGASRWLYGHSAEGDIVFHSDWDEFPLLFYHNDKNYYLVGLDPTFMYEYSRTNYRLWLELVTGQTADGLYPTIKNIFGAKYVFVDINGNQAFDRNLAANFNFEKVYEDSEAKIYRVAP